MLIDAGRGEVRAASYDLSALAPFDARMLAGWEAERYSVPLDQGWVQAKKKIDEEIYAGACRRIGGDQQRNVTVTTAYSGVSYKHVLLPVYLASYQYSGKVYRFQVNGQTGEVAGERPYSFWKIFFFVLAILGVVGLIIFVANQ